MNGPVGNPEQDRVNYEVTSASIRNDLAQSKRSAIMTLKRHEPSKIYSKVVEANGFVFTAGIVADDVKQDAKGQSQQILKEIDRLLKLAGTDKTKVVSATIWVTDIRHRDPMNEAWNAWTGGENLPDRACIEAKLADPLMLFEITVVAAK